ncbi:MAG: NAD(P)H-hydrate dehydratase [Anaerolineae bacterium]
MQILSVEEMQTLEKAADAAGQSYGRMMELAGQGVARALLERHTVKGRRILVLVGPGNNGGDGLVAARYLADAGAQVTAYLSRPREEKEDPVFQQAVQHDVKIVSREADPGGDLLRQLTAQTHILIDALLGTGATPPLRGTLRDVLADVQTTLDHRRPPLISLNRPPLNVRRRPFIVAVDGPSGMDFDSGEVDDLTLRAHLTVTFAHPKWGQFRFPAAQHVGELLVADIGIPPEVTVPPDSVEVLTPQKVRAWLPARPDNAHKGTFGKALIIAGSVNYTGAAALAAQAAVRTGAGLVTLGIAGSLHDGIVPLVPEATYVLLPESLGALRAEARSVLADVLPDYDALLIGPGLGQAAETEDLLRILLGRRARKRGAGFRSPAETETSQALPLPPLVIDADGLNLLSRMADWPKALPPNTILTPHPGEMARLTGMEIREIQEDRLTTARQHAERWGHVVVLKGAFTVVAAPDGRIVLLPFANAGLASAGTGDVLAGAIVALRAQGLAAFEAAAAGAYLHALSGEIARIAQGKAGMAAHDVVAALPEAHRRLKAC